MAKTLMDRQGTYPRLAALAARLFGLGALAWAGLAHAQTVTVYTDDFEGGVSGWSVNADSTTTPTTRYLGRFDNSPNATSRTFALPEGTERVEIQFDFYKFDSWDNTAQWGFDRFQVDVDGTQIFSLPFSSDQAARSGTNGNVDWSHSPQGPPAQLVYGSGQSWLTDQFHTVNLTVDDPGTSLDLTLRTALNQGGNDESGGFDNFSVVAHLAPPVIAAQKSVGLEAGSHYLPGETVEYTIALSNTGGPTEAGSIVIVDPLPANATVFTGDFDGAGNAVAFADDASSASGLACCAGTTVEFSDTTSGAPVFGYVPNGGFDPAVTHLRIAPTGAVRDARSDAADMSFSFRARIE